MEVEGSGRKAPAPKLLPVSPGVVGACVEWAKRCADYRGYRRGNQWQRGLKPAMTLFGGHHADGYYCGLAVGKVAEWYVANLFGVEIDLDFHPTGDGGVDLCLPCGHSQVKNGSEKRMLVKVGSRELRFADWFIATKWSGTDRLLSVLGYVHKQKVLQSPTEDGIGNWMNHVVRSEHFSPISALIRIQPISEVI